MGILDEPKIDCHAHVLDPVRFPYGDDIAYKPAGQEIGTTAQLLEVITTFAVEHVLLVQPNSGYGGDNRCMLDAILSHPGVFKGVAIVDPDADAATLEKLKTQGIVGVALNATFHGNDYYADWRPLFARLADLDMFVQLQVERDQLRMFVSWIEDIPVKVLIDHCGRPTATDGVGQPGFADLLRLADTGRVFVKLSGYAKFARTPFPFPDALPFVRALVDAFTLERCMWASDWPYLRAINRQDYGVLVRLVEELFPDPDQRRTLFWDTPYRLFGFGP